MRLFSSIVAPAVLVTMTNAVDDWMGCDYRDFCSRHREYLLDELAKPTEMAEYTLDMTSLTFDEAQLSATLNRNSEDQMIASSLHFTMWLYQDGITRVTIEEPNSDRYRVSEEPILTEGTNLRPVANLRDLVEVDSDGVYITGKTDDGSEQFRYKINSESFSIQQFYADKEVLRVNPVASLYVEDQG